jgi:hypothetical protein
MSAWQRPQGKGREGGGYMEALLQTLREEHGIESEETLAFIRSELVRSFKNGLMKGRGSEAEKGREQSPRGGRLTDRGRAVR